MTMFIIQSAILFAIAYLLGCIFGWLLRYMFGVSEVSDTNSSDNSASVHLTRQANPEPVTEKQSPPKKVAKGDVEAVKPEAVKAPVKRKSASPKPAESAKDDLKRIRGIGPQNEGRLNAIGVTTFAQIAAWSEDEQQEIGERLSFPGRIEREEWVQQAKTLASGGETEFAKRVDKGEVESSTGAVTDADLGSRPPALVSVPEGGMDDLTQIDGVGGALEKKLNALGIYTFAQIAEWTAEQQVWIGNELGFRGRPERENWVEDAKALASGGATSTAPKSSRGIIGAKKKS